MPFYQRNWNAVLGNQAPPLPTNLRSAPTVENDPKQVDVPEQPRPVSLERDDLLGIQETLFEQVQTLQKTPGAESIKEAAHFLDYQVSKDVIVFKGYHSEINQCTNPLYSNVKMIVREFQPTAGINEDDLYLKILRRLGKDCSNIIATMDIFVDESKKHIWLFQEFANLRNGMEWTVDNHASELQILNWTQSIYAAMDYLGSCGICHNSIQPKHIMLMSDTNGTITAKLSSFRDATIYWGTEKKDIIDLPCKPSNELKQAFFRAPETFGLEGECYDPVLADIWSLGATMFYFVSRVYPFDPLMASQTGDIDAQIRSTMAVCELLSDDAKYFLYSLMRPNTKNRTYFDFIPLDQWFRSDGSTASTQAQPDSGQGKA